MYDYNIAGEIKKIKPVQTINSKNGEFKKKNLAKSINVSTFVQDTEFLGEGDDLADYVLKTTKYESIKKH